ncbi:Exostosin-1 [Seminavis robusta]|uniref:Exostosin-1 n=1 Tax=Seminavis robusta TaxID=568900 RepID=A0A9N8ERQ7_9STRA|nr:Exostosin-1 [Seminavis robusta]|eukprot:Sro1596_g284780.1 Exostosin-1 (428) ;mRNA; f:9651-10934
MRDHVEMWALLGFSLLNISYLRAPSVLHQWIESIASQNSRHLRENNINHKRGAQYEITTTNYGWNTPADLNFSRRIVTSEFFNATKQHSHYNASAWADLEANPDPNRTLVVYLDVDSCFDFLYPKYVGNKWWVNAEGEAWGRHSGGGYKKPIQQSCQYIWRAAQSPALTANPKSRLVVLNCFGFRKDNLKQICGRQDGQFSKDIVQNNHQVVFASYSETKSNARPNHDLGLAPPAVKPVDLTAQDRADIEDCRPRKFLFSFQGRGGYGREKLAEAAINHTDDMFVRLAHQKDYADDRMNRNVDTLGYRELLLNSTFGGTPKGDSLYSYRFTETMSAGTIPVVYADDWLPPFNEHVVRWEDAAVFIEEKDALRTREILKAIPKERVCEMQKYVLHVYDTYLANRAGWVRGLTKAALAQSNITLNEMDQ